ncbi:MAG TPA: hypothetical protein VFT42_08405 [Solirubrobacteraceae bacterium]|nr:hypothetical protein [Solirubrobacteraceae bacterium]
MEVVVFLIVIALLGAVVLVVTAPLRARAHVRVAAREEAARADLEAAKESKYREIRDAELDYRTGKLSEADWRALDRDLRGEAVEILRRLDELDAPAADAPAPDAPGDGEPGGR